MVQIVDGRPRRRLCQVAPGVVPPHSGAPRTGGVEVAPIAAALALALALAVAVALGIPTPAPAAGHDPKGDYAPFADCPLSDAQTEVCLAAQTESGELAIGSRTIPVEQTMTLQGGVHEDQATGRQTFIGPIGPEDGDALSRTPQVIPGTRFGLTAPRSLPSYVQGIFNEFVAGKATDVMATTELAGPAGSIGINTQNLIEAKGVGLELPVKVQLSNPLLGESCYIGSNANPIVIPFTTGSPSQPSSQGPAKGKPDHAQPSSQGPAKGKPGHAQFKDEYNLVTIKEDSLLNDSFAAPRAEGCGGILSWLVDPAINAELGVPLAAGHNRAILNVTLRDANASAVKASE